MALVLAAACGAAFATSHSGPADHHTGTLAGHVTFPSVRHAGGVVQVFNQANRLVAHRDVRPNRNQFQFVLKPGRYTVKLGHPGTWLACRIRADVRVRANRTVSVMLGEPCGPY